MSFPWTDYLAVASHLKDHSGESPYSEGCLPSAISRAYYAALNRTRNLLRDQWGIEVPEDATIHTFIPQWFMDEEEPDKREIGVLLDRLRDRRRKADYDDEIAKVSSIVNRAIDDSRLVIERVSGL